jgi:hypothetical protein
MGVALFRSRTHFLGETIANVSVLPLEVGKACIVEHLVDMCQQAAKRGNLQLRLRLIRLAVEKDRLD